MKTDKTLNPLQGRVIGLDAHPDSFTAAALRGPTPGTAIVEQTFNRVPMSRLESWVKKSTNPDDLFVLEASGNSFDIVRRLQKIDRRALVLESRQLGKLKEVHANNDRISAVRIGKAFLAGTAKVVWVPDEQTQDRRNWFHAHAKAVKRTTQVRNRLLSYLSDNGVRLPKGTRLASERVESQKLIQGLKTWSAKQWQVIEILLCDLEHADQQRKRWRSLIGQEVASDAMLLSLMRLCGVRVLVAFALGAIIGDINRFASPRALVKYVGLNPSFDDSGQTKSHGGIGGHGRTDLRNLLVEAAQSILRSNHPLSKWAKRLLARKGILSVVAAAVARKLTVAVWYLMKGKETPVTEIDAQLKVKVGKLITMIEQSDLNGATIDRKKLRQQIEGLLKNGRTYSQPEKTVAPACS